MAGPEETSTADRTSTRAIRDDRGSEPSLSPRSQEALSGGDHLKSGQEVAAANTTDPQEQLTQTQAALVEEGRSAKTRVEHQIRADAETHVQALLETHTVPADTFVTQGITVTMEEAVTDYTSVASELVADARAQHPAASARYEAAILDPKHGADIQAGVQTLLDQETAASKALLGEASFEPQKTADVQARTADLLDAHTDAGAVDLESLSYAVQDLATENPSLAVSVKSELAKSLDPKQAVDLNRQLSGDWTIGESLELAWENPGQATIGVGKGAVNIVTGTAELVVNVGSRIAELGNTIDGAIFGALGFDKVAQSKHATADWLADARQQRDWTLDAANGAQQGGAYVTTAAEIAAGGYGLVRGGAVKAGRLADEAATAADDAVRAADDLTEFGDDALKTADEAVDAADELPPGYTEGFEYTDKAIDKFNFGKHLEEFRGPAPDDMYDPHAHHTLFKKGNGAAQQELVQEGQEILRRYDIDPIYGLENLGWAPNRVKGQHSIDALRPLVERLRDADRDPLVKRDRIVSILEQFQDTARRRSQ